MKRTASLLLLLFSAWLLLAPGANVPTSLLRESVASVSGGKTEPSIEHVAAQSAMPVVARAPLLARLPVAAPLAFGGRTIVSASAFARVPALGPAGDLRQAVRRVQTRRRVPRLGGGEPPWAEQLA